MGQTRELGTYDPREIQVTVGGKTVTGFAEDSIISIERNEDAFTFISGVDGIGTRTASANKSGRFTILLAGVSSSNDDFTKLAVSDELTAKATFPIIMKNTLGREVAAGAVAWFVKMPVMEFGKNLSDKEWVIETGYLSINAGGASNIVPI